MKVFNSNLSGFAIAAAVFDFNGMGWAIMLGSICYMVGWILSDQNRELKKEDARTDDPSDKLNSNK